MAIRVSVRAARFTLQYICSNEPYQEDSVHLYHGCASVMLELYCKPGRVSVHAFGDGLRQAQAVIEVCEK